MLESVPLHNTMSRTKYLKELEALDLSLRSLEQDKEYFVPKCEKHKVICNIAISNSKRYPKTFCAKCNERLDVGVEESEAAEWKRLVTHIWLSHPEYIKDGKIEKLNV